MEEAYSQQQESIELDNGYVVDFDRMVQHPKDNPYRTRKVRRMDSQGD